MTPDKRRIGDHSRPAICPQNTNVTTLDCGRQNCPNVTKEFLVHLSERHRNYFWTVLNSHSRKVEFPEFPHQNVHNFIARREGLFFSEFSSMVGNFAFFFSSVFAFLWPDTVVKSWCGWAFCNTSVTNLPVVAADGATAGIYRWLWESVATLVFLLAISACAFEFSETNFTHLQQISSVVFFLFCDFFLQQLWSYDLLYVQISWWYSDRKAVMEKAKLAKIQENVWYQFQLKCVRCPICLSR